MANDGKVKMISEEQANAQLQEVVKKANQQIQQLAVRLNEVETMLRDRIVEHLFSVVRYSDSFSSDFVGKCVDTLESYLTKVALEAPQTPDATGVSTVEDVTGIKEK